MKKIIKKVGENNFAPGVKESVEKCIPKSKVVMGRAKRGIFAGRHIQFGNQVSEDGGNKLVLSTHYFLLFLLAFHSYYFQLFCVIFSFIVIGCIWKLNSGFALYVK